MGYKRRKITHNVASFFTVLKKSLEGDREVLFAYIFGSYGRGKPSPLSDVDIAVYLDDDSDLFSKKLELMGNASEILKTDEVDIVILNESPLSLAHSVLKTGKLLFCKYEKKRVEFETRANILYCDAEPLRKTASESLIKRIKEGRYGT